MIKLTVEVTSEQLLEIANILAPQEKPIEVPTPVETPLMVKEYGTTTATPTDPYSVVTEPLPPMQKKGGVAATKMPGFGRTPSQIEEFTTAESSRVGALDEAEEERQQKKHDKELAEEVKELEVASIKEVTKPIPTTKKKPWEL